MESIQKPEAIYEKEYEATFQQMLSLGVDNFIELREGVSKTGFLKWLVEKKKCLLHGSNQQNIAELEPRLANCSSKEFGNIHAVYAVEDEILPIFYAIKDHQRFQGEARTGMSSTVMNDTVRKSYYFAVSETTLSEKPWSAGAVYILLRDSFVQGHDDSGNQIDEWASVTPVVPIGKIEILPEDFPYFDLIENIK